MFEVRMLGVLKEAVGSVGLSLSTIMCYIRKLTDRFGTEHVSGVRWFRLLRLRFSLRAMFGCVCALAVGIALVARAAEHQRRMVAELQSRGAVVFYDCDEGSDDLDDLIERTVGIHYACNVVEVAMLEYDEDMLRILKQLPGLETVTLAKPPRKDERENIHKMLPGVTIHHLIID